jgi:hypothetical protein
VAGAGLAGTFTYTFVGSGRFLGPFMANSSTTAVPGVLATCVSSGFRSTSWMVVWLLARLSISACSGVTSRFTTPTPCGLPSLSFLKSCPADSTSIFCSSVRVRLPCVALLGPGGLPEISMSTRMPGTTNPATPTTSLTRTATARMPDGIMAAKPPPAPFGASRFSTIGSPS